MEKYTRQYNRNASPQMTYNKEDIPPTYTHDLKQNPATTTQIEQPFTSYILSELTKQNEMKGIVPEQDSIDSIVTDLYAINPQNDVIGLTKSKQDNQQMQKRDYSQSISAAKDQYGLPVLSPQYKGFSPTINFNAPIQFNINVTYNIVPSQDKKKQPYESSTSQESYRR